MPTKKSTTEPTAFIRANLDELALWEDNYNQGDIGAISLSIRRFGLNNVPRVWNGLNVRAGNHTVQALRLIRKEGVQPGDKSWPPQHVYVDAEGRWFLDVMSLGDLSEKEADAFAIADNRTASLASQDENELLKHLLSINEQGEDLLQATGYDADDIENLRRILDEPITMDNLYKTPQQLLDHYLNGAIKQIVLYFDAESFASTVDKLTAIMTAENLDSNTSTVMYLIQHYEETKGLPDADVEPQLEGN